MDLQFRLPRWLFRFLFRKLDADLERRCGVTGVAARSFRVQRGLFEVEAVVTGEKDKNG